MQRASLGKSGSEAASQLTGRIARAFYSNSLVNTMDMTDAIQYILTAAQSLVSIKCLEWRSLGLLVYYSEKTSRHRPNVPKKILIWMLREARRGLKAMVGNRIKPDYHFVSIIFCSFCFFQADSCVPWQAMLKRMSAHIGHSRPKPGRGLKNIFTLSAYFLFFSVSFRQILVFPCRLCSNACQHILDTTGLSQAEVWRTYLNLLTVIVTLSWKQT